MRRVARPACRVLGVASLAALLLLGAVPAAAADVAAPAQATTADIAWVPVQRFWTHRTGMSLRELRAAVEGRHRTFRRVLVAGPDPSALWARLAVTPAASTRRATYGVLERAVERSKRTLGLVPAGGVRPALRALWVDGDSLFGARRISDLAAWPLTAPVVGPEAVDPWAIFDPGRVWTLVAGGDVMLDREVHRQAVQLEKGPHHPWAGGHAAITSRRCCTADGGNAITTRRVGPRGAMRKRLSGADITIVNHEGPAPDKATYHQTGLVFTFDPRLLPGLAWAGIDIVSLANNHIRNAGSAGVLQTIRNLREAGIRSVGAGRDARHARRPVCQDVTGVRLCFLAYDAINTSFHAATAARPGAARLVSRKAKSDIRRLERGGADVIVVVPHWGTEYVTSVTTQQRRWARTMVRAGADVILGAHSHVAGPIGFVDRAPVLYSLGNLLFDLPRFEQTEEAFLAELTFVGPRLAQLELQPTVIVDRSQVHLLDASHDGRVVLRRMRAASARLD